MPIPISMGDDLGEDAAPLPEEEDGGDEAGLLAAAAFLKAKDPQSLWQAFVNLLDAADASAESSQSADSGLDGAFPPQ